MKGTKFENIVGIDISKDTFDVALLVNNKLNDSNKFTNNLEGYKKLLLWLKSKKINVDKILFCAEKSGLYSYKIADTRTKEKEVSTFGIILTNPTEMDRNTKNIMQKISIIASSKLLSCPSVTVLFVSTSKTVCPSTSALGNTSEFVSKKFSIC